MSDKTDAVNEAIKRTKRMLKVQSKGKLIELLMKSHMLINYYEQIIRDMQVKFNEELDQLAHTNSATTTKENEDVK